MVCVVSVQVLTMTVLNLSFAASGFLGIYHLGAVEAFLRHGGRLLGSLGACAGASSGALVAALMITAPDKLEVEFTSSFRTQREEEFGQERERGQQSEAGGTLRASEQNTHFNVIECFRGTVVLSPLLPIPLCS